MWTTADDVTAPVVRDNKPPQCLSCQRVSAIQNRRGGTGTSADGGLLQFHTGNPPLGFAALARWFGMGIPNIVASECGPYAEKDPGSLAG